MFCAGCCELGVLGDAGFVGLAGLAAFIPEPPVRGVLLDLEGSLPAAVGCDAEVGDAGAPALPASAFGSESCAPPFGAVLASEPQAVNKTSSAPS
jgi:hypothetical protein